MGRSLGDADRAELDQLAGFRPGDRGIIQSVAGLADLGIPVEPDRPRRNAFDDFRLQIIRPIGLGGRRVEKMCASGGHEAIADGCRMALGVSEGKGIDPVNR